MHISSLRGLFPKSKLNCRSAFRRNTDVRLQSRPYRNGFGNIGRLRTSLSKTGRLRTPLPLSTQMRQGPVPWPIESAVAPVFSAGAAGIRLSRAQSENVHIQAGPALSSIEKNRLSKMELDWQVCSRARVTRDARFDGKFFIGVFSSGVYCRSICPAPPAKEKNVRYFPTAAAAAEAGFRPCLRCRPECSPGTPAWLGTPNTVSRALRLISDTGLEEGGIEALAERLGVGSRHLRRLFLKHLGATPSAVAKTRQLHFAKKLIDETSLRMSDVALASGFGCVRRFNAGIRKVYHRTPTEIRRLARQRPLQSENQYVFRLRFRPPYDWQGMLAFLAPRATPGVEAVGNGVYRRTISLDGNQGCFEVSLDEGSNLLAVHLQFGDPRSLFFITERIRTMFDLNADWAAIVASLRTDPVLITQVDSGPGLRVPGCWNGFELATRAILVSRSPSRARLHWLGGW